MCNTEDKMKKALSGLLMVLALALATGVQAAGQDEAAQAIEKSMSPVEQFTGKYWVETALTSKEAYLFGIESALEVEYYVDKKMAEAQASRGVKKPVSTLSPFEKGWMQALDGVPRRDIVTTIDNWYAAHPDQLDRPVMSVIWHEVIQPRLTSSK